MITNFKIFESKWFTQYWMVNTEQPKFLVALKKIGMSPKEIEHWKDMFDNESGNIFLFKTYEPGKDIYQWTYASINYKSMLSEEEEEKKYMGEVTVEDWEVDAEKYNI